MLQIACGHIECFRLDFYTDQRWGLIDMRANFGIFRKPHFLINLMGFDT